MADSTWTGFVNSLWNNAGNWTAGVPGAGFTATFNATASVGIDVLGTGVGKIVVTAGTVTLTASGGNIDTGAGLELAPDAATSLVVSVAIGGVGGVTKTGTGAASLTSTNTFSGATTVSNGTLTTAAGSLNATSGIGVAGGSTLLAVNAKSGATLSGAGTMSFSGAALTFGTVNLSVGGVLNLTNTNTVINTGALSGNGSINFSDRLSVTQSTDTTFSGTLTGSKPLYGALFKGGTGNLTLSGSNAFAGGIFATTGTLTAASVNAFGGSIIVNPGGIADFGGVAQPGTLAFNGGTAINVSAFTGIVSVGVGIVTLTQVPNASRFVVFDAATLNLATLTYSGLVSMRAGATLTNGSVSAANLSFQEIDGSPVLVDAVVTGGSSDLTVPSRVEVVLSRANTFRSLRVIPGTGFTASATAGNDGAFGASAVFLVDGGTLDFGGYAVANDVTVNTTPGGVFLMGGENYNGNVNLNFAARATIVAANALNGNMNIGSAATLIIEGQHTGGINNGGTVEIGTAPIDPPVDLYTGACGSTYAVRAA